MTAKKLYAVCISLALYTPMLPLCAAEDTFLQSLDLSLEELRNVNVSAATKTDETTSLTPAIISVITAQDIEMYGYDSVASALRHVASFVDNYDLAIHNFGIRGINSGVRSGSRTIKFMIDGQPVPFQANSQYFIDRELISMKIIDRIEIIRGPVSALYGANALLGVVNIVTKTGRSLADEGTGLALSVHSTNDAGDGYAVDLVHGNERSNWDYRLALSAGRDDRQGVELPRSSPDYNSFTRTEALSDDARPFSFYGRGEYRTGDKGQLTVSAHYQELDVENPFADLNPLKEPDHSRIALSNWFVRTDYDVDLSDRSSLKIYAAYAEGDTTDDDKVEVGANNFFLDRRFGYDRIDFGAEALFQLREQDSLLIGIDAKNEHQKIETFSRVDRATGASTIFNPHRNESLRNKGAYLQYLFQITDNWRGIAGVRVDDDSIIDRQESTRLGVVGQLPKNIVVKLLAGTSFQAPSPELLFHDAVQAGDIIGNESLEAQEASTIEASVTAPLNDNLQVSATFYRTEVDDLVVFRSDASNLFATNSSKAETDGVELEFRFLWRDIDAYFNYAWQDTEQETPPDTIFVLEDRRDGEIYPEQSANLGISYRVPRWQANISFDARWVDERPASTQNVLDANQFYFLDDYVDSTLTITTTAFSFVEGKRGLLRIQAKNLFDDNYANPGFGGIEFPSLGRQILIGFEQRF